VEDTEDILNVTLQITLSQIIDMVIGHIKPQPDRNEDTVEHVGKHR